MLAHIALTQIEACASLNEQLKEIDRLRAVNTQFNRLFTDIDGHFMKIILGTLKINNLTQKEKNTYLFKVMKTNHPLFATSLLKLGADANARDKDAITILHHAACFNNNLQMTKILLEHGAHVNKIHKKDTARTAILHYAAINGNKEIVRALLKKGAKVDKKDKSGRTPLHWAHSISIFTSRGNYIC